MHIHLRNGSSALGACDRVITIFTAVTERDDFTVMIDREPGINGEIAPRVLRTDNQIAALTDTGHKNTPFPAPIVAGGGGKDKKGRFT